MTCAFDGCSHPPGKRDPLCAGHRKQKQRGVELSPLRPYGLKPTEHLRRKALEHAEAEGGDEYRRTERMLREYAHAVAAARPGKRPRRNVRQRAESPPRG